MHLANIIGKQVVSIHFQSKVEQPFAVQEQAAKWCNEILAPAIEEVLEPYCGDAQIIRVDSLFIDLQTSGNPFTTFFAQKIAKELAQQIEAAKAGGKSATIVSSEQSFEEAFIIFLKNGFLPWWCSSMGHTAFEQKVRLLAVSLSDAGHKQLLHLLSEKMIARRMIMALPDGVLVQVLAAISRQDAAIQLHLLERLQSFAALIQDKDLQRRFLLETTTDYVCALCSGATQTQVETLRCLLEGRHLNRKQQEAIAPLLHSWVHTYQMPVHQLQRLLNKQLNAILPDMDTRKNELPHDASDTQQALPESLPKMDTALQQKNGFYIHNAGLILTAPFLPRFFTNLGIVADGRFNSKDMAVALMQYLVTGEERYAEYDTVFAKLLCGLEPEAPIIIVPHLPDGFKEEAVALLEAIIGHWPALKNTSVGGLRDAFLQREGKLSLQDNAWLLQVSQKAYDMLLNDLPWTIHTVKLPWMERPLKTEWV